MPQFYISALADEIAAEAYQTCCHTGSYKGQCDPVLAVQSQASASVARADLLVMASVKRVSVRENTSVGNMISMS